MGVIKDGIREAMNKYRKDRNLLTLLEKVSDIADHSVRFQWLRDYFDTELEKAYKEILGNRNPSSRDGDINYVET